MNKISIDIKHISRKFHFNPIADYQSYYSSLCLATTCSVHKFFDEPANLVLDPVARCSLIATDDLLTNGNTWNNTHSRSEACKGVI